MGRCVLMLGVLAVLAAGCGGDSTETETVGGTSTTEAMTKAEFIEAADEICAEHEAKQRPLEQRYARAEKTSDWGAGADALDDSIAISSEQNEALQALVPPAGDEELISEIYDLGDEGRAVGTSLADAIRQEDGAAVEELVDELRLIGERNTDLATGYGFKVCGVD